MQLTTGCASWLAQPPPVYRSTCEMFFVAWRYVSYSLVQLVWRMRSKMKPYSGCHFSNWSRAAHAKRR